MSKNRNKKTGKRENRGVTGVEESGKRKNRPLENFGKRQTSPNPSKEHKRDWNQIKRERKPKPLQWRGNL